MSAKPLRQFTPEMDAKLRKLWAEGLSGKIIAQRMGISHMAVFNRKATLGLPARRGAMAAPRTVKAPEPFTPAARPGASIRPANPAVPLTGIDCGGLVNVSSGAARTPPEEPRRAEAALPVYLPAGTPCRWITHDDRRRMATEFCTAPRQQGSSYCSHHHGIAWIRVQRRQEPPKAAYTGTARLAPRDDVTPELAL